MKAKDYIWPVVGICAVGISVWLLYRELRSISLDDVLDSFYAIRTHHWILAAGSALLAYSSLAGYDRIALMHLKRKISWLFIALCSFTTYALSHNIGASVVSGAVVRYRAYSSQGMPGSEIAVLIAFCSFTFILGVIITSSVVLLLEPHILMRFNEELTPTVSIVIALLMLAFVLVYVFGSWLGLRPLKIGSFRLEYPRMSVVVQQLIVAPLELIGAAGIIYLPCPKPAIPDFSLFSAFFWSRFRQP